MIHLAVFDMAGTTIDDGGVVYQALEAAVAFAGATVDPADLQTWMGTDKVAAITALLPLGGVTPTDALVATCFATFKEHLSMAYRTAPPVAFDGVSDAIAQLRSRGIKVALSTGFDRQVTDDLLTSLGWKTGQDLDAVVTTSDVAAGRPAPYMIHHAMELAGVVDVRRVLAAGDTLVDLQAARNAGAIAVGVLTGALSRQALEQGPHDHILAGVADVPSLPECLPEATAATVALS